MGSETVLVFGLVLVGFVLGVVVVLSAQALGVVWIVKRLGSAIDRKLSESLGGAEFDTQQSLNYAFKKQGLVWVLEADKLPKGWLDRPSREHKRKKEFFEVSPIKKYGKISGQSLVLIDSDGLHTTIELKGCMVEAVSAGNLDSKKWAKKLPIKVESKTSAIYNGRNFFYIYLDTSWEKEAWCKALRLASCDPNEKFKWFAQLHEEFHSYLTSLNAECYSFMKPLEGSSVEAIDRASKLDCNQSKVRQFFKKLSRKTSKVGLDNKSTSTSLSGREERKNTEKLRASQDAVLAINMMKNASTKHLKSSTEDDAQQLSSNLSRSNLSNSGRERQLSIGSGADCDEKFGFDEATLCWNLLIFRLFFDVKGSAKLKSFIQAKIQKQLSSVRTPSYVGEVILTDFNTGNFPPCIMGMRALPMEMSEVWAIEVDIQYSGGALLEIETRLEVQEMDLHRQIEDSNPDSSNVGDVPADLLEGFEYLGEQLNLAEGTSDLEEPKEDGAGNTDVSKSFKSTSSSSSSGSRWKSLLNSVAKHVSQVPLSLAIRVTSLRGTLRLYIKPPPSDQLWFGFSTMPDLDLNLESSVGDHKITNGHVACFLLKLFKIAIRENIVLPNCESVSIPFMFAENDDWAPFNVAPFIWAHNESKHDTFSRIDSLKQPSGGLITRSETGARNSGDDPEHELQKPTSAEVSTQIPPSSSSTQNRSHSNLEELRVPLLEKDKDKPQEIKDSKEPRPPSLQSFKVKPQETGDSKEPRPSSIQNVKQPHETTVVDMEDNTSPSSPRTSGSLFERQDSTDDEKPKKMGRREKMHDLRRKMSEKFEEKKRHIGEKSRHIVEKMRGP